MPKPSHLYMYCLSPVKQEQRCRLCSREGDPWHSLRFPRLPSLRIAHHVSRGGRKSMVAQPPFGSYSVCTVVSRVHELRTCHKIRPAASHSHTSSDGFATVGLDYIGPLPETPAENKYILNAIDYFTRFGWAWPMKAATEEATICCLNDLFDHYV
jgi:hypothetical protein